MTRLYIATQDGLLVASGGGSRWQVDHKLAAMLTQAVAVDPLRPELVYCATYGDGLWRSHNAGASWQPAGEGVAYAEATAVAVSETERAGNRGVVWAGTEPSALYRSEDGGIHWEERPGLRQLPSAATWSFPPRPWTHHVRWITPDATVAGRIFVSIEAGGVMRSLDSGRSWEDRRPDGPIDAHTLRSHRRAPDRIYAAAGDGLSAPGRGYAESRDGGCTWHRFGSGLRHHYLWGLVVDPGDPDTVVVSASKSPEIAHNPAHAEATVYRRSGSGAWEETRIGLPDAKGTLVPTLATNEAEVSVFYLACNWGLFRSPDGGLSWEQLPIPWTDRLHGQRPQGLTVAP